MNKTYRPTSLYSIRKICTKAVMLLLCASMILPAAAGARVTSVAASSSQTVDRTELNRLEDEIEKTKTDMANLDAQIEKTKAELGESTAEKVRLDTEMNILNERIDLTDSIIIALDDEIATKEAEIANRQQAYEQKFEQFGKRLRISHEEGQATYLDMLFGASSLADFLVRVDRVGVMLANDTDMMNDLLGEKEALETARGDYTMRKSQQVSFLAQLESDKTALDTKRIESANYINNLQADLIKDQNDRDASESSLGTLEQDKAAEQTRIENEEERIRQEEERKRREEEERKRREEEERKRKAEEERLARERQEQERLERERQQSTAEEAMRKSFMGEENWMWPLAAKYNYVSSPYGYRTSPIDKKVELHNGADIPAPYGTSIMAANSGKVVVSTYHWSYGNYIEIDHGGGYRTLYAHCSKLLVRVGDEVTQGQVIALVGSTGASTGNHLHFSMYESGQLADPKKWFGSIIKETK